MIYRLQTNSISDGSVLRFCQPGVLIAPGGQSGGTRSVCYILRKMINVRIFGSLRRVQLKRHVVVYPLTLLIIYILTLLTRNVFQNSVLLPQEILLHFHKYNLVGLTITQLCLERMPAPESGLPFLGCPHPKHIIQQLLIIKVWLNSSYDLIV